MSLIDHAEFELRRAGLFDADSDYSGMLGQAVMKLVRTFAAEGHSGYSAGATLDIFSRVARFKTLTALTSSPEEWQHIPEEQAGRPDLWQNKRQSSCFSNDGGKTLYDVDEAGRPVRTTDEPA